MENGLRLFNMLKFALQQVVWKMVGLVMVVGLAGLGDDSLCDCLCVDGVADFLVSGLVQLATFVVVSRDRVRATRACFFGIQDDKNEPVFGEFAGCELLATVLASFEAALVVFV